MLITSEVFVEYGPSIDLFEAENTRVVRAHTTVRLPHILDAWSEEEGNYNCSHFEGFIGRTNYIFMKYIAGSLVFECWPQLDELNYGSLQHQLYDMLAQLQRIELDTPYARGEGRYIQALEIES